MNGFLRNVSLWPVMVFFLVGFPAATIALQALIRVWFPELRAKRHNDVAGFLLAVIGVIYAVTVGFMIADQWENYTEARERTWHEAYTLASVAEGSAVLDPASQEQIRVAVVNYNQAVIDWWSRQDRVGTTTDIREEQTLDGLLTLLDQARPSTDAQRAYVEQAGERVLDVMVLRDQRLHEANRAHLESPLWLILSISGAVTIGFCLLFGLETQWVHYILVSGLSITIAISFLLIVLLNYPLSGVMPIAPDSYESVVRDLGR